MFKRISQLLNDQDQDLPAYHQIRQQHQNMDELTRVASEYLAYKKQNPPGQKRLIPTQQALMRGSQVAAWKQHQ